MPITKPFTQFLNEVEDLRIAMRWKDGQALMNHLVAIAPHLSKELHGSHLDPFFYKKNEARYKACLEWLKEKWPNA